ncbi:histidine-rich glycoprotein-like [Musca vetustissima]|uniref:histidine-rich glycoprotein-like n=1 Tax=Musca vetustissima TaxID=27455 RepID=UPI002AB5E004|nr:histidine-rich glycoprotein-like [Musca vetustissima]
MKFVIIALIVTLCVAMTMAQGHQDHYEQHQGHHSEEHHEDHHDNHHVDHKDYYSHPKYEYKYGVKDLKTEDIKEQWEERDGDKVHGGYLLKEADGTIRVVNYHADDHTGFHAEVKTIGHAEHPQTHHKDDDHHDEYHIEYEHDDHYSQHHNEYDNGHYDSYGHYNSYHH